MQSFLASPFFQLLAVAVGFLVGWLARESMLLRRFNTRLAQADRDRDFARKEAENLAERLSLSEADLKKAAFDAGQMTVWLENLEAEKTQLQASLELAAARLDQSQRLQNEWAEKSKTQAEQILGLRAQNEHANEAAAIFSEKEDAEKRLRADFGAALKMVGELQKRIAQLENEAAEMRHQFEAANTQLLDYQLSSIELPNIAAQNGQHGPAKKRAKKTTAEAVGESNVESATLPSDDFKSIQKISPAQQAELARLGISTIAQLAVLEENQILEIAEGSRRLAEKMRKEDWVGQAKRLTTH